MRKHFYLCENEWIELDHIFTTSDLLDLINHSDQKLVFWKRIEKEYGSDDVQIWYHQNFDLHRIDGPAYVRKSLSTKEKRCYWYVNHVCLFDFQRYLYSKNIIESIFKYVQKYPNKIKEIEILSRHNKWLNDEELLKLHAMSMFT